MIYRTASEWRQSPRKRVLLFGMSGLGKTTISNLLRAERWFHYSIDYRIGTRYMGEHIADMFKREAMKVPLLRELLLSDSVYIASNITFNNLAPLSTYLGKPGNSDKGGLTFAEYLHRQDQHREAEMAALRDTVPFIERAHDLYGYDHFVCDSGGSICEVVNPDDPADPILRLLSDNLLMVWIRHTEAHTAELVRRFDRAPKPMYYQPEFLKEIWHEYLAEQGMTEEQVDPDAFLRWGYARLLAHRHPRYESMARNWGVSISAEDVAALRSAHDFEDLIARALEAPGHAA